LTTMGSSMVPRRLASRGLMSKTSTPCIFPRISRRSRPVDCSASVGTVPGCAPGGRRSSYDLISEGGHSSVRPQAAAAPARSSSARGRAGAARHVPSSFLKPSRTLGVVCLSLASPAVGSMGHRMTAPGRRTAHKRRGKGAAGDGARGHSPGRDNGGALEEHGESNWVEWRGGRWGGRAWRSSAELTIDVLAITRDLLM
jgi:hypothetical protein